MSKTPDEIKKGLFCCWRDGCATCPYDDDCIMGENFAGLARDALTYIQQLESRLAQVERERDTALCDMTKSCVFCKHSYLNNPGIDYCKFVECCQNYARFEWRGVCERNTKEDSDG